MDMAVRIKVVNKMTGMKGYDFPLPHFCQRRLVTWSTILMNTMKTMIRTGENKEQAAILAEMSPQAIRRM